MKVVKTLPKFAIIYMHNPFTCIDCKESNQCIDDFIHNDGKRDPAKMDRSKTVSKKSRPVVLVKKTSIFHQKLRTADEKQFKKSAYKQQSKQRAKKIKLSKKVGKLKERNIKKLASALSVIKNKRNKGKKQPKKKRVERLKSLNLKNQKSEPKIVKEEVQKPPGKGTLKRKRWYLDKLNSSNENYEDDIFENQKFFHFQGLIEDETDSIEKYENIKTPQLPFSLSPKEESPSPIYRDCYSPTELTESRKGAEEYRFRRGKMKKVSNYKTKNKNPTSENKPDVQKTLEAVVEILNKTQKMLDKHESDSDEDSYFPDLFDPNSAQYT